ncbi:MAG: efflux RND transporter periplasmic adaptor subunit [Rhodospirillales bacterium]
MKHLRALLGLRKFLLPLLALIGAISVFVLANRSNQPTPPPQMVVEPAVASFPAYVAGSGIIEASTRNIAISTPVGGVVTRIYVRVGSVVKASDPLFRLDDRDLAAQLQTRRANAAAAKARVPEAEATLGDVRVQLRLAESITDQRAISAEDLSKRRYAVQLAQARLKTAAADAANAAAEVAETETNLDRLTVRAPIDGQVLQVNIRLGEYAQTGVLDTPLMMMGSVDRLNIRVDIDENDAWRFQPGAPARAYLRGNRDLAVDLRFEYVEPYVVPKRSLTGASSERVDTRVLQVVYSFENGAIPAYIGQQVDVFVDAPPVGPQSPPTSPETPAPATSQRAGGAS